MEQYELDFNNEAKCPFCGADNQIESESYKGDGEYFGEECYSCEQPFEVCCNYEVTFSSKKLES